MESTDAGPIDVVMLEFPGNQFNGASPSLRDLVVSGRCGWSISCSCTRTPTAPSGRSSSPTWAPTSSRASSTSTASSVAGCSTPTTSRTWRAASTGELGGRHRRREPVGDPVRQRRAKQAVFLVDQFRALRRGGLRPPGRPAGQLRRRRPGWDSFVEWRTAVVAGTATAVSNRPGARARGGRSRSTPSSSRRTPSSPRPAPCAGTGGSTAAGRRRHDGRAGTARRPAEPGRAHRPRVRGGKAKLLGL